MNHLITMAAIILANYCQAQIYIPYYGREKPQMIAMFNPDTVLYDSSYELVPSKIFYRDYFGIHSMTPEKDKMQIFDSVCQHQDSIIWWVRDDICKIEYRDSLNKVKVGISREPTKYKSGITYYTEDGFKVTTKKWVKVDTDWMGIDMYRWRATYEKYGLCTIMYTDDIVIDKYILKQTK